MALDDDLNRMLGRLRIMESAIHGQHSWTMIFTIEDGWVSEPMPVEVVLDDHTVSFSAPFSGVAQCQEVALLRDGEVIHIESTDVLLLPVSVFVLTFAMETAPAPR